MNYLKDWNKAIELDPNNSGAIKDRKILLEDHPELKP
jgi:hypothetical protein